MSMGIGQQSWRAAPTGPRAIVLSLFDTGLGAVRSLGRAGIPVIGLDFDPTSAGFASRFCDARECPHPVHQPEELLRFLIALGDELREPAILFPASDAFTLFLSRHRDALCQRYRFLLPRPDILEATVNKRDQYRLAEAVGTPIATTHYPETLDEVRAIRDQLDYPAFIKPYYGHLWREHFPEPHSKGFKVHSPDELVARYEEILPTGLQALVQSIILGPNTNHFKVCAYLPGVATCWPSSPCARSGSIRRNSASAGLSRVCTTRNWPSSAGAS